MHFAQRAFLSRPIAVLLGRRVFRDSLFHFIEKQLAFDLVMRLPKVSGPFGGWLAASAASGRNDDSEGKRSR